LDIQLLHILVLEPSDLDASLQSNGNFCYHVCHFFLHQLGGSQWPLELLSLQGVLPSSREAKFSRPQSTPSDAVSSIIQTSKRTLNLENLATENIY